MRSNQLLSSSSRDANHSRFTNEVIGFGNRPRWALSARAWLSSGSSGAQAVLNYLPANRRAKCIPIALAIASAIASRPAPEVMKARSVSLVM